MNGEIYKPADFWKSAIMKMPDNSFFELLRSVFGKIKTPFNKQQLLNDLETFLLREDIQKTVAAYIDKTDAKIISAIALFGEPVTGQLENFFSGEISYAQLQDIIVNLEERFIIYRFMEENTGKLALNPLLKSVLNAFTDDTSALFPVTTEESRVQSSSSQIYGNAIVINDITIAALYSFISRRGLSFYKSAGVIRKRIIEEGKNLFPNLELDNILGAMQVLGLFYAEENILVPDKRYFNEFSLISARERMEYLAAALLVYGELTAQVRLAHQSGAVFSEILPPLFRARIREIVKFINVFINSLNIKTQYQIVTLTRIAEVLKAHTGTDINTRALFDTLEKTGLIVQTADGVKQTGKLTQISVKNEDRPVIVIETGSSILVYPEIDFSDAISLASVLNICETGAAPDSSIARFELDRDSAVRAFDNNISADDIIELLTRLSGGKKDKTLIWNLKDWHQRYNEVSLRKGIILKLSENRRYLTETYPLASMIIETYAPGLYLLNENAIDDAADALQKAGIDIISRRREKKEKPDENKYSGSYFPPLSATQQPFSFKSDNAAQTEENIFGAEQDEIISKYKSILGKMRMGEVEKTELTARIERRLILCEEQLKDAEIRYEKLEARHLDYAGKQNIAKQAIAGASSVEAVWTFKGKEERIFGVPQALEKDKNDLILVIDTAVSDNSQGHAGQNQKLRIPLAKISLLRKIKRSIFE